MRNSGAHAVVEGLGDHGCEYMTGGSVIVLGGIGRNFAAGMSGGLAFIYDRNGAAAKRINREMVSLKRGIEDQDESLVLKRLREHLYLTASPNASFILEHWTLERDNFLTIIPDTYRTLRSSLLLPRLATNIYGEIATHNALI